MLVVQVYSCAEEAARQVHEGESRVSPFAGVGASSSPPAHCAKSHTSARPNAECPKMGPHISLFGGAPGMKKMLCALSSFFEAGFVVGYIRSIRPAPP